MDILTGDAEMGRANVEVENELMRILGEGRRVRKGFVNYSGDRASTFRSEVV